MGRCIEANDLVRKMTLQANRSSLGEIAPPSLSYSEMLEIIADAPTADVVPKSEVVKEIGKAIKVIGEIVTGHIESDNSLTEAEIDIVLYLAEIEKKYMKDGAE